MFHLFKKPELLSVIRASISPLTHVMDIFFQFVLTTQLLPIHCRH